MNVIVSIDVEVKGNTMKLVRGQEEALFWWGKTVRPWATETACRADTEAWLLAHPEILDSNVSQAAAEKLYEMSQQYDETHTRPSWDELFLQVAHDVSKRSPDSQTQIGAVIVDTNHHILSVGYNGWMPGIDDTLIPNTRPGKYPWSIHAEMNAILNCEHKPRGATLYCTCRPCVAWDRYPGCIQFCAAAGLAEVVYNENSATDMSKGDDVDWEVVTWLLRDKLTVRGVNFTPQG